ncbi:heavy-metal-associated domain protein, partial [Vibrio parahaemolyticus VPTS-2010_2]
GYLGCTRYGCGMVLLDVGGDFPRLVPNGISSCLLRSQRDDHWFDFTWSLYRSQSESKHNSLASGFGELTTSTSDRHH